MRDFLNQFQWLESKTLGNSVLDYILSVATFFILWFLFSALRKYGLLRLQKYLSKYHAGIEGLAAVVFGSIHAFVFPLIALHFALQRLDLNPRLEHYLEVIVLAGLILQVTLIVVHIASFLIMNSTFGRAEDDLSVKSARLNFKALASFALWTAGFLFFISNLGVNITTFVTGLGIGGIAIALAAQNILGDVFNSFTIALDKPFEVGDTITFDNVTATVEHIGLKTTRLRNLSGEAVVMPNSEMTKIRIHNFKRMFTRRVVFTTGVTYDTSLDDLKSIPNIIKEIINAEKSARFERCFLLVMADSSLNFETVYFVDSPDFNIYAKAHQNILIALIEEFKERKIEFAFPTRTVQVQSTSAKTP